MKIDLPKLHLMQKKHFIIIAIFVVILALYWLLGGNEYEQVLDRAIEAVKNENLPQLMSCFTKSYSGQFGESYEQLQAFAKSGFQRFDNISISKKSFGILNETSKECMASLEFKIVGSFQGRRYYFMGSIHQTEVAQIVFRKTLEGWKMQQITLRNYHGGLPLENMEDMEKTIDSL